MLAAGMGCKLFDFLGGIFFPFQTGLPLNFVCVCVYSNSRNDVPRVAQR